MIDRLELETFYYVSEYNNFSKAAEKLYVSQSTISNRIKSLENRLDEKLLQRNKYGASLTPAGIKLYEYVRDLQTKESALLSDLKELNSVQQTISISITPVISDWFYDHVVSNFGNDYRINTEVVFSNYVIERVMNQKTDIGIIRSEQNFHTNPQLISCPIVEEEIVFVAHKDHPIFKVSQVNLKRISKYPLIAFGSSVNYLHVVAQIFNDSNAYPSQVNHSTEISASKLLLLDKMSIAVLSTYLANKMTETDTYKVIKVDDLKNKHRYSLLLYNKYRDLSPECRQFIEQIKQLI